MIEMQAGEISILMKKESSRMQKVYKILMVVIGTMILQKPIIPVMVH